MKIKLFSLFTIFVLVAVVNRSARAYPNFIGYGYTSCTVCHFNPYGNGPLTDYGRAVGASTISDDRWWFGARSLDQIGKKSGFLYSQPSTKRIRPSLGYRGLLLRTNLGKKGSKSEWINMDGKASLVIKLGPQSDLNKFFISGTIGYAPVPRNGSNPNAKTYRSREYYIAYRPTKNLGFYAGLLDKIYGLRIANHTAFSRTITSNTMNDQTHSIVMNYAAKSFELGIQPFIGNLGQKSSIRQKGFATHFEYNATRKFRPGFSTQVSKSEFLKSYAYAFHARAGFGEGNSVMAEIGQVKKEQTKKGVSTNSMYWMIQTHSLLTKGLFFLNTIESLTPNTSVNSRIIRWGPGIQYFLIQGLEFRMEVFNTRLYSESANTNDRWDFTGQVHLWF